MIKKLLLISILWSLFSCNQPEPENQGTRQSAIDHFELEGPSYDSEKTESIVKKMLTAHGGFENWKKASSIFFHRIHSRVGLDLQNAPEIIIDHIELPSRKIYQQWPRFEGILVDDGKQVWTMNWKNNYPPKFIAQNGYYLACLPWLTQDKGVKLEYLDDEGQLPESKSSFLSIKMTFEESVGDTPQDYYILKIDPNSYLYRGCEFIITYGALLDAFKLPPERKSLPITYYKQDRYIEVDGLMVPQSYQKFNASGSLIQVGQLLNWSFTKDFDDENLSMPENALIDISSPIRKNKKSN